MPESQHLPLRVFLRKERRAYAGIPAGVPVTAYYKDALMTAPIATNPWQSRPTRRNRWVNYNCARHRAVWLPDQAYSYAQ